MKCEVCGADNKPGEFMLIRVGGKGGPLLCSLCMGEESDRRCPVHDEPIALAEAEHGERRHLVEVCESCDAEAERIDAACSEDWKASPRGERLEETGS